MRIYVYISVYSRIMIFTNNLKECIAEDKYAYIEAIPELYSRLFYLTLGLLPLLWIILKPLKDPLVQWGLFGLLFFIKTYKKKNKKRRGNLLEQHPGAEGVQGYYILYDVIF